MKPSKSILVPALLALASSLAAQAASIPENSANWSNEQKEAFLSKAEIVGQKTLSVGITQSSKLKMSDGVHNHDAHLQTIDEFKTSFASINGTGLNFRDCYKFNIAAYRLSRLLGMEMVPVSVERKVKGNSGAVTWWVDDVLMMEKDRFQKKIEPPDNDRWNNQMFRVRVFNELIYNTDPNLGNLLITHDWNIHIIDFTRAFRMYKTLKEPDNLTRIDEEMLERLKALDEATLTAELGKLLRKAEIRGLLARRDKIVEHFENRFAQLGEAVVLSEVPRR